MDTNKSPDARQTRLNSIGWHIQRLTGRLDKAMSEALSQNGLNFQQFPILMTALEHPGLTQNEYAKQFRRPAYSISRAIDTLVEKGFLERRPDPESRRAHNIHPTASGYALGPVLFGIVEQVNADLVSNLSASETTELKRLLAKLLSDER